MLEFCKTCSQFKDEDTTAKLWDVYNHSPDPAHQQVALVFFPSDEDEPYDEDDHAIRNLAMEKDMSSRGLCVTCGRPDLSRLDLERYPLMSDEDMREHFEMAAEYAAERRAGC